MYVSSEGSCVSGPSLLHNSIGTKTSDLLAHLHIIQVTQRVQAGLRLCFLHANKTLGLPATGHNFNLFHGWVEKHYIKIIHFCKFCGVSVHC